MCSPELGSGETKLRKRKKPQNSLRLFDFKIGIAILSRALGQVPSAQVGLTSLFGMGRGDPHRHRRHKTELKILNSELKIGFAHF
jgi:hypothetical protein